MKNTIAKLFTAIILMTALTVLTLAQNAEDFLITKNSVGKVRLGMTVGEAKKIWKDYKFERSSDGEFSALVAVKNGNEQVMTIIAGEKGNLNDKSPIQNNARIESIEVWSKDFQTVAGVSPRMPLKDAEEIYGKIKNITRSEIEMREYAEFSRQPEGIDFRLSSKADFAGIDYQNNQGLETTKQYVPSAYIFNVLISKRGEMENISDETKFTSVYTDLKTDCKSEEADEGGHVSTFCKGAGNYRIHYFDSATTLEFNAETLDGKFSRRLASQSLNYLKENDKIEWRLADGKPFAVIMPVFEYRTDGGLIAYPAKIVGEKIIVRGLDGFERLDREEAGKGAAARARAIADNDYADAIIPAKRIEIPTGKNEITLENVLVKGDEKIKYRIRAEKGQLMTVTINTVDYAGLEGPVMYGIVSLPDGGQDGQPGGKIFDAVLDETGDYEILVAQNKAKSNATNVRFKVKITLETAAKNQ